MTGFLDYIYITIEMEKGNNKKKKMGNFFFLVLQFHSILPDTVDFVLL